MADTDEDYEIIARGKIEKGSLYRIRVQDKEIEVLITHHADWRARRWGLKAEEIIEALIYPDEVLRGMEGGLSLIGSLTSASPELSTSMRLGCW